MGMVPKHPRISALDEGVAFIRSHIIPVTDRAFDDFAKARTDAEPTRHVL
jgi:hypothetical protein